MNALNEASVTLQCPRRPRKSARVAIVMIMGLLATLVAASPASADTVTGVASGAAIVVNTGAKNYSNHTQYVYGISVLAPDNGRYCWRIDAWTQNWYSGPSQACGPGQYFYINRWVASGSYVCGRVQEWHYNTTGTACIVIRVIRK